VIEHRRPEARLGLAICASGTSSTAGWHVNVNGHRHGLRFPVSVGADFPNDGLEPLAASEPAAAGHPDEWPETRLLTLPAGKGARSNGDDMAEAAGVSVFAESNQEPDIKEGSGGA